jgi:predicted small metal-binding protein
MKYSLNHLTKGKPMKTLRCRDAGFDCDEVVQATSEEEVLSQAAEHAQSAHNVQVTPELAEQIKTLIKDDEQS